MTLENSQLSLSLEQENTSTSSVNSQENTTSEEVGQRHTKKCIDCGDALTLGGNWTEARQAQGKYLCQPCWAERNKLEMWVDGKYISKFHRLYKPGRYKSFDHAAFSSLENYNKSTEGNVYVITNDAFPGWVKIGKAVDVQDRLKSYQTYSPYRDYKVIYSIEADNMNDKEKKIQDYIELHSNERRNEWFRIDTDVVINLISSIHRSI